MDKREPIINFIKLKGPSVPTAIAKELKTDSLLICAFLSEMKETGKIKISHLKIGGGSPLYYIPGQEPMLQDFSNYLGEKEKKIYEILKQKKVVRESDLVPVFRAAIKDLKDFALSLDVTFNNTKEVFWKWYLYSDEEATEVIKQILTPKKPEQKAEEIKEKKQEPREIAQEPKPERKREEEAQKTLKMPVQEESQKEKPKEDFYEQVKFYFDENKIKILEEKIIKKKAEIDFIISLPSNAGNLTYFAKAKNKKKVSDGDLSSAFVEGQSKRLPVLFISKGDLMKKAAEMLDSEFRGMKFNKID